MALESRFRQKCHLAPRRGRAHLLLALPVRTIPKRIRRALSDSNRLLPNLGHGCNALHRINGYLLVDRKLFTSGGCGLVVSLLCQHGLDREVGYCSQDAHFIQLASRGENPSRAGDGTASWTRTLRDAINRNGEDSRIEPREQRGTSSSSPWKAGSNCKEGS